MTVRIVLILSVLLVSGCSKLVVPETVEVPIPVPCVKSLPDKPNFKSDTELVELDDYSLVIALASERLVYRSYSEKLEVLLMGCQDIN